MDLSAAVGVAARGLRRYVQALCEALPGGVLHLLPRSAPESTASVAVAVGGSRQAIQLMIAPSKKLFVPLFTQPALAVGFAAHCGWSTAGVPGALISLPAVEALSQALTVIGEKHAVGAVIDPGRVNLDLDPRELASLVRLQPIPLIRRLTGAQVMDETRNIMFRNPKRPVPPELLALATELEDYAGVERVVVKEVFDEERDVVPHLALDVRGYVLPEQQQLIGRVFLEGLQRLPASDDPASIVTMMFNALE